jgi:hypothetical protein
LQLLEEGTMADPSGTYTFTARYLEEEQFQLSFIADVATGALNGTLGTGADATGVAGRWDDATSHITFNDSFGGGDILLTHYFDGYVSQEEGPGGYITGLAGTYHDFRIHVAEGLVLFTEDSGGWCASRPPIPV